jgi:hypothetical protein
VANGRPRRLFLAPAVALAVGLATFVAPFASSSPDGLQKVARDEGFAARAEAGRVQQASPIRDYAFPGVADERLATALAGFAGTLAVFAAGAGVAAVLRRRGPDRRGPTVRA